MLAALNSHEVKRGNVMNAYTTAPITGKFWTILGPEFSADTEKKSIIVRALYVLKPPALLFDITSASAREV